MSKKTAFLSAANMADMTKRMFAAHQNERGGRPLSYFQEQVSCLMQQWRKIDLVDSYESLTADPELELAQINQDFYREYVNQFLPAGGYAQVKKLETMDDYLNYDIQRDPPATVNADTFRRGNNIPLDRKWVSSRHYDRDSSAFKTSHGLKNKAHPGMDELWEHVNKPADTIDRGDVAYYGQKTDDDSAVLINTSWN